MSQRGLSDDELAETEISPSDEGGAKTEFATGPTVAHGSGNGNAPSDEGPDRILGTTLQDRYIVIRKLGQGGMGAVYEATHTRIKKRVAIKVLLERHAEASQIGARLEQEARLASSIGHPNIIDITDFGQTADGRRFVVMEYLDGESLAQCLEREGCLPAMRSIAIARQVASALGAAHQKGILHRDIKPENVFLVRRDGEDFVKVVDFGISKAVDGSEAAEDQRLTQTGMVLGTPLYMSPEQARGENLDHRADVYALGVLLYEMLTGEVPFKGNNYLNVLSQVTGTEAIPPRQLNPALSEAIELVILKGISKDRDERYQDMAAFDSDLGALHEGGGSIVPGTRLGARRTLRSRILGRKRRSAWPAIALLAAGVALFFMLRSPDPAPTVDIPNAAVVPTVPTEIVAPPVLAKEAMASIEIVSTPPGAVLYEGNRRLGKTPHVLVVESTRAPLDVTARLEGYETATAKVRPREDNDKQVEIQLTPVPERKKPRRKPSRRTPRTPAENDLAPLR